jgi:hypothetical protein
MTGSRSRSIKYGTIVLICGCALAGGLYLAGCGSDPEAPPPPTPPVPPLDPWFFSVWGSGPDDVYVVGQPGLIYHYDGSDWSQQSSGTAVPLTDVWSPNDGQTWFVCGHEGVILTRSGSNWSRMNSGTGANLFGLGSFDGDTHVCGQQGVLKRNSGSSWSDVPVDIIRRDSNGAAVDTLDRTEDIGSLTTVGYYGITGSDGTILMEDSCAEGGNCVQWPWELRLVTGGQEWVYGGWGDSDIAANFIGTRGGRAFQLQVNTAGRRFWRELYSPSLDDAVYGVWVDTAAPDVWRVFYTSQTGKVIRQEVSRDPAAIEPVISTEVIYDSGLWLLDIWGAASDDLFAVGIDAQIMHYYDPNGGDDPDWYPADIVLPEELTKTLAARPGPTLPAADKFGNPF